MRIEDGRGLPIEQAQGPASAPALRDEGARRLLGAGDTGELQRPRGQWAADPEPQRDADEPAAVDSHARRAITGSRPPPARAVHSASITASVTARVHAVPPRSRGWAAGFVSAAVTAASMRSAA